MLAVFIVIYILAYALVLGFFLVEKFVRQGKAAKNMDRTGHDKGSTTFVSVAMGTAFVLLIATPFLLYWQIATYRLLWLSIIGLLLGAGGLVIRGVAFSTLGRFFSRTLREVEGHTLVTTGIYKYIRHPGYLSDFMIFIGVALALGGLILLAAIVVLFIPAYIYRINIEEKMLVEIFGEQYTAYQKTSKRLLPFIL